MNEIAAKISIREYQLITLHLTIQLVSQHLFHWKNPKEQKAILVIVLMAPIYAVVSFVTANFLALMYSYLSISISKNIPHVVCLDHRTFRLLKYWTWEFVVIRPVCSILMIALQIIGFYPSWLSWTFTIVLNVSVSLALYYLVIFYHVFSKERAPHNPLAKFLCIKGIIFFSIYHILYIISHVIKINHFFLSKTTSLSCTQKLSLQ
ncbi:hypothetical protein Bca4012_037841 [Brassica carinata]